MPRSRGWKCELARGDLRDRAAIARAVRGCDEVYHVAADYRLWVPDPAAMYAANVDGTRNVIEAARARRRHNESSIPAPSARSEFRTAAPAREDTPVALADMLGPYKRSKFLAEQVALEAARAGAPVVIVNPSTPIGALRSQADPDRPHHPRFP